MRETELKFAVDRSFQIDDIRGQAGVAAVQPLDPQELTSTYYDTTDLRLARSGVTLRFRTGEEEPLWTVKFPSHGTDARVREELNYAGSPDEIPAETADLVIGHCRSAALEPVATLVTTRDRWRLIGHDDVPLAEVCDDNVAIVERGHTLTRFREVELESLSLELDDLNVIGDALSGAGAVPTEAVPKAVRALGPRATAPPDLPPAGTGQPTSSAEAVARMIIRATDRVQSHHAAARLGDAEGVHQMRVATRRLRSDLRSFAPLVDEPWSVGVQTDLAWLADALGEVRDSDVMMQRLAQKAIDLRPATDTLFSRLGAQADRRREALHEVLRSDRYRMLLETLVRAAQNPPLARDASRAISAMSIHLAPLWEKLATSADNAADTSTDDALHHLRIRVKRVRYAAEALADTLPRSKGPERLARRAAKLQSILGEHQDAAVAQRVLHDAASAEDSDTAFVIAVGRLIEREHAAARTAARQWRSAWRSLKSPKATNWFAS